MKTGLIIFKKELKRFFTDRRMLAGIMLPGVLIFIIYTIMGHFINTMNEPSTEYTVYIENEPDDPTLKAFFQIEGFTFKVNEDKELTKDEIIEGIKNKEIDAYIVYEEGFLDKILNPQPGVVPNVKIYHNSTEPDSQAFFSMYQNYLISYESQLTNRFDINNPLVDEVYDFATKEDVSMMMMSMILPMLLMTFLFGPLMGVSSESIAGEKERGTFATLLVTPASRLSIAFGKIGALALTGLTSSVVSFIGLMGSIPNLLPKDSITLEMYGIGTFILIFLVMVVTVLFMTTILTIISTVAKSVKEASTYGTPIMMAIMAFSFLGMSESPILDSHPVFFVPILNSLRCFSGLLEMNISTIDLVITILSNLVFIGIGTYITAKMFNNEKIIFNK